MQLPTCFRDLICAFNAANLKCYVLIMLSALPLAGCHLALSKAIMDPRISSQYVYPFGEAPKLVLNETVGKQLPHGEKEFSGKIISSRYPEYSGLKEFIQAFDSALNKNLERVGLTYDFRPLVHFIYVQDWPCTYEGKVLTSSDLPQVIAIQCCVLPYDTQPTSGTEVSGRVRLIRDNVFCIVHEMTEFNLLARPNSRILGDYSGSYQYRFIKLRAKFRNETRWFRESISNYVADGTCRDLGLNTRLNSDDQKLNEIGESILCWNNLDKGTRPGWEYYDASDALLARIIRSNPPNTLPRIMTELNTHESIDGVVLDKAIAKITSRTLKEYVKAGGLKSNIGAKKLRHGH
ncbi:MAG: hypothetical protein ABFD69_02615 [Candidatus Sumerlaeia bacterium]